MKNIINILLAILIISCNAQTKQTEKIILTISPTIDQNDEINNQIISTLTTFLRTKNNSLTENEYWIKSDFNKYIYPYSDLYKIENSKHGQNFYQPTLMEITPTDKSNKWIVKIAFIGHNPNNEENQLRTIYNIIAQKRKDKILFSQYLDFATKSWTKIKSGEITYIISPQKNANWDEINQQKKEIQLLREFFETSPIPITYYSCVNPKELFQIKGFDYNPMMYVGNTGGMAELGNIIFSANSSEVYTHEIVHLYTTSLFPNKNKFLDEGLATYIAGSGKYDYVWHRNKLKEFLKSNPDFKVEEHTNPYERLYYEEETPIPYLIGALICERTIRLYGKEKLFELLKSKKDLWNLLKEVGLNKENINREIQIEINTATNSGYAPGGKSVFG